MRRLAGWAAKSVVAWGNMRCGRTPCSPFFVATRSPTERLIGVEFANFVSKLLKKIDFLIRYWREIIRGGN